MAELDSGGESVRAVCGRWRISRECAYKWWRRYKADGLDGLREASRAPRRQPRKLSAVWGGRIAAARDRHPRRVRPGGEIRWQGRRRFVGESFEGCTIGLRAASKGAWRVYFYGLLVGELHDGDSCGLRSARYRRPPP